MRRLRGAGRGLLALAGIGLLAIVATGGAGAARGDDQLQKINHIVVIYEENHSFDNLYGGWEGVDGLANADAAHTVQVGQAATRPAYHCLLQNDVNLTSPPLPADCADATPGEPPFTGHLLNAPFSIEQYIPRDARTCPQPGVFAPNGLTPSPSNLPGGCTRDIVHRFYSEQYQLDGGRQDRYTTGSDAAGLTQPPVADRCRLADVAGGSGREPLDHRLERNADGHAAVRADRSGPGPPGDAALSVCGLEPRVRGLRGEHHSAGLSAVPRHATAAAADRYDDRR
jgi:hypothetical protein